MPRASASAIFWGSIGPLSSPQSLERCFSFTTVMREITIFGGYPVLLLSMLLLNNLFYSRSYLIYFESGFGAMKPLWLKKRRCDNCHSDKVGRNWIIRVCLGIRRIVACMWLQNRGFVNHVAYTKDVHESLPCILIAWLSMPRA